MASITYRLFETIKFNSIKHHSKQSHNFKKLRILDYFGIHMVDGTKLL